MLPNEIETYPNPARGDDTSQAASKPGRTSGGPEPIVHQPAQRTWTRTEHPIDFRVSVALPFGGQYYFAFFAGPERRNSQRLAREGQTLSSRRALLLLVIVFILLGMCVFCGIAFLFIIKSAIGVDLMQGDSFLHPLFEVFFN